MHINVMNHMIIFDYIPNYILFSLLIRKYFIRFKSVKFSRNMD